MMEAYQERVVAETEDLANKIERLSIFMEGSVFKTLDADEQGRLQQQYGFMCQYHQVLMARIAAFK